MRCLFSKNFKKGVFVVQLNWEGEGVAGQGGVCFMRWGIVLKHWDRHSAVAHNCLHTASPLPQI